MKLRYYSFAFILIIIPTLFTSCKQSLNMQSDHAHNQDPTTINIEINNDYRNTALLFEAVRMGDLEIVKDLIKLVADLNLKDQNGDTPLHVAAQEGNTEIARLLIKGGADVNVRCNSGETPLHLAAQKGKTEVAELLINSGAKGNARSDNGQTPLHWAALKGHKEVAKLLIDNGANVNEKHDNGGTPLHQAAWNGHKEVAEFLIENGADLNVKNNDGETPLHWAAEKGYTDIARLLIEKGADVNAKDNKYGWTPLHEAGYKGNLGFFKFIRDILLGKNEPYNMAKTNRAYCLNHFLEGKGILSNSLYDRNLIKKILKYSDLNIDLSIKNNDGKTPLDIAKEKGHTAIIEILEELENVVKNDQMIPFTDYIASK